MTFFYWQSFKRILAFVTVLQMGVGPVLAQEYIVVDADGDGDSDMAVEVPGPGKVRYNFSDLVHGEPWVGRIVAPPPRFDFTLESSIPTRIQETQAQQWDAGYAQVQNDIKKLIQPIEVPPVPTTPFDPAQYGLQLQQQQSQIDQMVSDALRLQAYIYRKNELTSKIGEINNWIDKSIVSTFDQKNLINQTALDDVSTSLNQLVQETASGKLPKTPLLLPKLSPLTQTEILDIVQKQIEKHYAPAYTAVTQDAWFFGIDASSVQSMRDQVGKRALNTANSDRVVYQKVLDQLKLGTDRTIKNLSKINDSINAQWKELPKKETSRRFNSRSDTLPLEEYEFTSAANVRDPKSNLAAIAEELATVHSELVQVNPRTAIEENARRFGLNAAIAGDQALSSGDEASASAYRDVAVAMLDVALGFTPGVGWAKDVYEAVSGQSLLTGQSLSSFERGIAVFGALTVGLGSKLGSLTKAGEAIVNIARTSKLAAPLIEGVVKIAQTAIKLGFKTKGELVELLEFTARIIKVETGAVGDIGAIVNRLDHFSDAAKSALRDGKNQIGFTDGSASIVFASKSRSQHAARHLTDAGLLPQWSSATYERFINIGKEVLERPLATFDHTLGNFNVKGFHGKLGDRDVVFFVYKEGQYATQIATSFVPNSNQMLIWGLK